MVGKLSDVVLVVAFGKAFGCHFAVPGLHLQGLRPPLFGCAAVRLGLPPLSVQRRPHHGIANTQRQQRSGTRQQAEPQRQIAAVSADIQSGPEQCIHLRLEQQQRAERGEHHATVDRKARQPRAISLGIQRAATRVGVDAGVAPARLAKQRDERLQRQNTQIAQRPAVTRAVGAEPVRWAKPQVEHRATAEDHNQVLYPGGDHYCIITKRHVSA